MGGAVESHQRRQGEVVRAEVAALGERVQHRLGELVGVGAAALQNELRNRRNGVSRIVKQSVVGQHTEGRQQQQADKNHLAVRALLAPP